MPDRAVNLLNYLRRMGTPYGCRALHCHVSGLPKAVKTRANMARAVEIVNDLGAQALVGKLFLLNGLDIVYICVNLDAGLLRQAGSNIHRVFERQSVSANPYGGEDFATVIDVGNQDTRLLAYAEALVESLGEGAGDAVAAV